MDIRYCVKCFDENDECALSIVCPIEDLFEILDRYSKMYKVKAFILSDNKEF